MRFAVRLRRWLAEVFHCRNLGGDEQEPQIAEQAFGVTRLSARSAATVGTSRAVPAVLIVVLEMVVAVVTK